MKREYKGYTIEQVTRLDWVVRDSEGKMQKTEEGRIPRTLKEAKALIDTLTK